MEKENAIYELKHIHDNLDGLRIEIGGMMKVLRTCIKTLSTTKEEKRRDE